MTNRFLGGLNPISIFASLVVLFVSLPVHSFIKAYTAKKLGDPTADNMGRLTMNPFAHIDPWGAVVLVFFHFGWSKPMPIDSRNLKNPKRDLGIIAATGPLSYLLMGFLFCIPLTFILKALPTASNTKALESLLQLLSTIILVNVQLGVINLLPIPPFDGGDILAALLPQKIAIPFIRFFSKFQGVITVILLVAFSTGILTIPFSWASQKIIAFFLSITYPLIF